MVSVQKERVRSVFPPLRVSQKEAAQRIGQAVGDPRRAAALARGSQIETRAVVVPPEAIESPGTIAQRNAVYRDLAPRLAMDAARAALQDDDRLNIGLVVAASCTGYMVPGWDVELVQELALDPGTARLPITQAGCGGGLIALARAVDYLRAQPGRQALVVAAELCSLAFHPNMEAGNLTAALIFGDGAAAALLTSSAVAPPGAIQVIDICSRLIPNSREALGFALTDAGFYPVLTRELTDLVPEQAKATVCRLLARNELTFSDLDFWLVHAGGAAILDGLAVAVGLTRDSLRWSWQSLREAGNTSSVSILDVLARFTSDPQAPAGTGVLLAFGPGVSVEAMLVRRC
jgi:predicted naringenin-chalcone synthase